MKTCFILIFTMYALLSYSQDSVSVLFIGNSYTYVNDLPLTLKNLALSKGDIVTVDSKTNGGYTFQNHTTDPLTFQKIKAKPWDFVVLQAQSQEPSFPFDQVTSNTLPFAKQLSDSVYANHFCSQVLYYMTWGRKVGDPQWDSINTFDKMNERLRLAYLRFTNVSEGSVSPVGVAWKKAIELYPTVNLYVGDGSHPSVEGTYLTACVFYASIFRKSPVGATFTSGIDATVAANFQEIARQVVLDSIENWYLRSKSQITIADFEFTQNLNAIQCLNKSWRAQNYFWDFNDGNVSTLIQPTHQYANTGNYNVTLKASSECNDSLSSKTVSINLLSIKEFSLENIQWNYSNDLFRSDLEKNNFEDLNVLNELGQTIAIHWIDNKTFQLKNTENKGLVIIHYVYQGKTYVERISLR